MTVIAAALVDGGAIVAADCMVVKTNCSKFPTRKIVRVRGGIAAAAGDDEAVQQFLEWHRLGGYREATPKIRQSLSIEGIFVTRDSIFDYCGPKLFPDRVGRPFHAIGSGGQSALAVMAFQKKKLDPRSAVIAVCSVNSECGLPVSTMRIKP